MGLTHVSKPKGCFTFLVHLKIGNGMIPKIFAITRLCQQELDLFSVHQVAGFILFSPKKQIGELTTTLKDYTPRGKYPYL